MTSSNSTQQNRAATRQKESAPIERIAYKLSEASAATGIPYQTLLDSVKRKELAAIVYGKGQNRKRYLVFPEDLRVWLRRKRIAARWEEEMESH